MRRFSLLSAVVLFLFLLLLTNPPVTIHAADTDRISIDARVGYDNTYVADTWTPVTLTVNGGTTIQPGRIEWVVTADSQPTITWQRDFINDPATPTVIETLMVLPSYARSIIARVRVEDRIVASTQIDAQVAAGVLNLIVADQTTLGDVFRSTNKDNGSASVVRVIPPAQLPSSLTALQGVNTILIGDTRLLTPSQRATLRMWVSIGGRLALSGTAPPDFTDSAAFRIVPGQNPSVVSPSLPAGVIASAVVAHPAAIAMHSDNTLLYRRDIGRGEFIQSALTVADTNGWSGQYWYWQPVLAGLNTAYTATMPLPATSAVFDPFINSLTVPAIRQPAPWVLFGIAVGYILLIGPVTYAILKRRNQLDYAWATIPLTAVIVSLLLIAGVYISRGTSPRLYGLQIIEQDAQATAAASTTTIGIYAPFRAQFNVGAPDSTTLQQLSVAAPNNVGVVASADHSLTVSATIGSMSFITSSTIVAAPLTVQHALVRVPELLHGTVRISGVPLRDAYLQIGSFAQALGDITPERDVRIDITQNTPMFPCDIPPTQGSMLSVQRVYEHITGPCGAVNPQRDGRATLYGWIDGAGSWPLVAGVPYTDQKQFVAVTLNIP